MWMAQREKFYCVLHDLIGLSLYWCKWIELLFLGKIGLRSASWIILLDDEKLPTRLRSFKQRNGPGEPGFYTKAIALFRGVFVDVGAGSGEFLPIASKARRIIAFEPDPRLWKKINQVGQSLRDPNRLVLRDYVISDKSGRVSYSISSKPFGSSLGKPLIGNTIRSVQKDSCTLDYLHNRGDFIFESSEPVLLKIDVEGSEHLVLKGARDFIRKYSPTLLIEYHYNLQEILKEISLLGYEVEHKTFWYFHGWIKASSSSFANKTYPPVVVAKS